VLGHTKIEKEARAVRNRQIRKGIKRDWQLYCFLILPFLYTCLFSYGTMYGILIAFKDYNPALGIFGSKWVGLENIIRFVKYHNFWQIVRNTVIQSLYSMVAGVPIPIILALALNCLRSDKYRKVTQYCMFLPHFVSMVLLIGMLNQFLNPIVGFYGVIGRFFTGETPVDLFTIPETFRHMEIWSGIWQESGWNSIMYLAALMGVDMSLHEAATVDGATRLQRVRYIDLPAIIPTFVVLFILRVGSLLSSATDKVLLMQNQLNLEYSEMIGTYTYKQGFESTMPDYSYSTAIGLFNSILSFILLNIANTISKRVNETSLW